MPTTVSETIEIDNGQSTQLDIELVDADEACRMLGGSRPLNRATLYRGMSAGHFTQPIKIGNSSRWVKSELISVIRARISERDNAK